MLSDHRPSPRLLVLAWSAILLAGCGGSDTQGDDPSMLQWGGDLLGGGSSISVQDSVAGDVIVAGGEISFAGVAGGDYLGAGATQEIGGRVAGDVRAAGRQIRFSGQVAKNVTAAGGQLDIGDGAVIEGNAYLAGGLIRLNGTIEGSLRAAGQDIILDGTVEGDVDVRGGSLRVGSGARITGDLTYGIPSEDATIDPAAQIGGTVTAIPTERPGPSIGFFRALLMIGFLVAGLVVVAVFPGTASAAEAALRRRPAASLGFGAVWVILVPICAAAIGLTGVGIPLALIILALYLISIYIARAVVAVWLGGLLLRGWPRPGRGRLVAAFLVGGIILLLVGLVPILGGIVAILATLVGLGSLVVAYRGRRASPEEG